MFRVVILNVRLVTRGCDKIINKVSQYALDIVEKIQRFVRNGTLVFGQSLKLFEFSIILIICSSELSKLFEGGVGVG